MSIIKKSSMFYDTAENNKLIRNINQGRNNMAYAFSLWESIKYMEGNLCTFKI